MPIDLSVYIGAISSMMPLSSVIIFSHNLVLGKIQNELILQFSGFFKYFFFKLGFFKYLICRKGIFWNPAKQTLKSENSARRLWGRRQGCDGMEGGFGEQESDACLGS